MFQNQKNFQLKLNALGHAYNDAYHFIIPLLLPFFRQEFLFSYFESGLILTIHVALRSIFSLIFGSLADHYNHKHVFIAFGFVLSSLLLGSVVWISNLSFMIITLLLMAIGVSAFHPLATTMVGEKARPNKRGRDLSLFSAAGTLGLSIMTLLFGWLVQFWGWRITCFIISIPGFILAWGYMQLRDGHSNPIIQSDSLRRKNLFMLFFLSHGLRNLGTWAILSFLPIYATDYIGLKSAFSAWIVSILFIGVLSGSLFISRILDQKNPVQFVNFATLAAGLLILALTYTTIPIVMGFIIICIGLSQGFYFPALNTWLIKISSNKTRGKLFGSVIFVEGISATIAPSLYGWLADHYGLVFAYRLASIPILISFLLYIMLYRLAENDRVTEIKSASVQKRIIS